MFNTFGTILKVSTFGESHGKGIGGVLDGCPSGICLNIGDIQKQLDRRKSINSDFFTTRKELDNLIILSGLKDGITLGSPIGFFIENNDVRSLDYSDFFFVPRPSHSDLSHYLSYKNLPISGSGRFSARETTVRVVAGSIINKFLKDLYNIEIIAWVDSVGDIKSVSIDENKVLSNDIEKSLIKCPDLKVEKKMCNLIKKVKDSGDSIGGSIVCVCRNIPKGIGSPVFDKLESNLGNAMLSIPSVKCFEIGAGISSSVMNGSVHNDLFMINKNKLKLKTNESGGVQGGVSIGENIIFKIFFKPPSSIAMSQKSVDFKGNFSRVNVIGRHDACVVPRAVPVVESMTALVLGNLIIKQFGYF